MLNPFDALTADAKRTYLKVTGRAFNGFPSRWDDMEYVIDVAHEANRLVDMDMDTDRAIRWAESNILRGAA